MNQVRPGVYTLSPEELKQTRAVGSLTCPKCQKQMRHFTSQFQKEEFFCMSCKVSAPLYQAEQKPIDPVAQFK